LRLFLVIGRSDSYPTDQIIWARLYIETVQEPH